MPAAKRFIDRYELAILLECSVQSVAKNEARWQLEQWRSDLNARVVRYHRRGALTALLQAGLLLPDPVWMAQEHLDHISTPPASPSPQGKPAVNGARLKIHPEAITFENLTKKAKTPVLRPGV